MIYFDSQFALANSLKKLPCRTKPQGFASQFALVDPLMPFLVELNKSSGVLK